MWKTEFFHELESNNARTSKDFGISGKTNEQHKIIRHFSKHGGKTGEELDAAGN